MIAPLLEALREKDPATWKRFDELELATYKQYDDYGTTENYIYQEDLIEPVRLAWLQAVLQETCQVKGWFGAVYFGKKDGDLAKVFGHSHCAIISWKDGELYRHIKQFGNSSVESLLRCYLEAII